MWRFRHLIVLGSLVALGYYFSIMFQADWKVLTVLGALLAVTYWAANRADPIVPEDDGPEPPEPPPGPPDGA